MCLCIVVKDNTTMHQRIQPTHAREFPILEGNLYNLNVLLLPLYKFNWCEAWTHTESATLPKTAKIFLLFIYTRLNCSSCGLDNYTCMPVHSLTLKKKKKVGMCMQVK